jgi:opacity protein-like surface antigen
VKTVAVLLFAALMPAAASAQAYARSDTPHLGTWEIGGGAAWTAGYDAGSANATLSRPGSTTPLTLFALSGRMLGAPGAAARLGLFLSQRFALEATFDYSRPVLRALATDDFEGAPDTEIDGVVVTYLARGSLLYHFGAGRFVPFVSGGGGSLRQIDDANADVVTGTEIHGGGGFKYWFGSGGRRLGFRADAGLSARSKSVAFEQKRRIVPMVGAGLSFQF